MPKVFNVLELVIWCSKHFYTTKRIIRVSNTNMSLISLRPVISQKMLKLLELNKELYLQEADSFIANNSALKKLLTYFIDTLLEFKSTTYQFNIDLHKEPYQEFVWLFAQVIGQDTTTYWPWYVIFILCCTFIMYFNFN